MRGVLFSGGLIVGILVLSFYLASQHVFSESLHMLSLAIGSSSQLVTHNTTTRDIGVHVVRVIDGDTVVVNDGIQNVTVRMIGINSPETGKGNRPLECFGNEASAHLTELLIGKDVTLIPDETQDKFDKYGRTLGYIEEGGADVNSEMITDGYAYEYTYRTPYLRQSLYKENQITAKWKGRGLWSKSNCATVDE